MRVEEEEIKRKSEGGREGEKGIVEGRKGNKEKE